MDVSNNEEFTSRSPLFSGSATRRRSMLYGVGVLLVLAALIALATGLGVGLKDEHAMAGMSLTERQRRAEEILSNFPLIDGHNDLAFRYRSRWNNSVNTVDLNVDLPGVQTNIPRLRAGKVGAQFWAAYERCRSQHKDAVRLYLDQIDVIKRFIAKYPDDLAFVSSAQEIVDQFNKGKILGLIGVEGGHAIDSDLSVLRMFYELGARYMTLVYNCNTPWGDGYMADVTGIHEHNGLTEFGEEVVREMNRLGMMVDLSHVSKQTMEDAIRVSQAPVIFSHSSSFTLCRHYRNVQDSVLKLLKTNGGIIMINFYTKYINESGDTASVEQVADHVDYVKNLIGVEYVGIGADFEGVETFPTGLENASKYPNLFVELLRRGWSVDGLEKLAGRNLIRVFQEVEKVRDSMARLPPFERLINKTTWENLPCRTSF